MTFLVQHSTAGGHITLASSLIPVVMDNLRFDTPPPDKRPYKTKNSFKSALRRLCLVELLLTYLTVHIYLENSPKKARALIG